jgi:hypothetical protein
VIYADIFLGAPAMLSSAAFKVLREVAKFTRIWSCPVRAYRLAASAVCLAPIFSATAEMSIQERYVDGLGPRGDALHTLQEHIVVESLQERGRLLAGLFASLD